MNALMTIDEVASYFKTSKYTIYRLIQRKEIPASKIGNQWRFKREELDEWLKTNSVTTEEYQSKSGGSQETRQE